MYTSSLNIFTYVIDADRIVYMRHANCKSIFFHHITM